MKKGFHEEKIPRIKKRASCYDENNDPYRVYDS